ncbi:hypothetical protein EDB19DRAFT_2023394 [Suillus lakei]|nr:hypothetical protein EDB19DRAFT_2023394 [Suillus lakei]
MPLPRSVKIYSATINQNVTKQAPEKGSYINSSALVNSVQVKIDQTNQLCSERIGKFLVSQLQVEYESKEDTIHGLDGNIALAKLNEQILAYSKGAWPFNRPLSDNMNILKYWTGLMLMFLRDPSHANKSPQPKTTVKFRDLVETIFGQEIDGNESEAGDGYNEDSDAWLDSTIDLVDEDDPGYLRCRNWVFVGSEDVARLDWSRAPGPSL